MKTTNKTILHIALIGLICFVPVAFGQNQAKKVDAFVKEKMAANHIPGLSLAVVREGKIIFAKGYGMVNLELSVPANEKNVFPIYSITKTFTAVAVMMLVEEGKISLEDSITKHLAELPADWNKITIRHLLTHTSGLSDVCDSPADPCFQFTAFTRDEIIKFAADLPVKFQPGERWDYGNTGFFLLGMLIEKISGKPYEQFLHERIFQPLEMRDTRLENMIGVGIGEHGAPWREPKEQRCTTGECFVVAAVPLGHASEELAEQLGLATDPLDDR